jgi:hypothetical protein
MKTSTLLRGATSLADVMRIPLLSMALLVPGAAHAQLAPTGTHYAGRPSDTGHGGMDVGATGGVSWTGATVITR